MLLARKQDMNNTKSFFHSHKTSLALPIMTVNLQNCHCNTENREDSWKIVESDSIMER